MGEAIAIGVGKCGGHPRYLCVCHLSASEAAEIEGILYQPAPTAARVRSRGNVRNQTQLFGFSERPWEGV